MMTPARNREIRVAEEAQGLYRVQVWRRDRLWQFWRLESQTPAIPVAHVDKEIGLALVAYQATFITTRLRFNGGECLPPARLMARKRAR